ncbi:MAG: hypothetical protein GX605_03820 [Chloroflexi bacterium]|nr:hypothetical protein [Chloroflexota bacterium]
MNCGFTFQHYCEIIAEAVGLGYRFARFQEVCESGPGERLIIMRHDIDFLPRNALRFAEIESGFGVHACYFVRLHARQYNPFDLDTYRILKTIRDQGHEIGLHYEPEFAGLVGEDVRSMVRREKEALERVLDTPIVSAAAHNPTLGGKLLARADLAELGIRYEAYDPAFTQEMKYISDSGARWREGCACGFLGRADRLQVLTHPIWWFERSMLENY